MEYKFPPEVPWYVTVLLCTIEDNGNDGGEIPNPELYTTDKLQESLHWFSEQEHFQLSRRIQGKSGSYLKIIIITPP
jgi:hypothetical protein